MAREDVYAEISRINALHAWYEKLEARTDWYYRVCKRNMQRGNFTKVVELLGMYEEALVELEAAKPAPPTRVAFKPLRVVQSNRLHTRSFDQQAGIEYLPTRKEGGTNAS